VSRLYAKVTSAAADQLGLTLQQFEAHSVDEIEPALKAGMQAMTLSREEHFSRRDALFRSWRSRAAYQ
jgi:hypothetical protein